MAQWSFNRLKIGAVSGLHPVFFLLLFNPLRGSATKYNFVANLTRKNRG